MKHLGGIQHTYSTKKLPALKTIQKIITQIPNVIDLSFITSRFAPKAAPIVY